MATAEFVAPRQDTRAVGLVCAGHFFSHFYMLLLPPLFPLLREVYGVGFTELGAALAVFSITSGLTQAPVGFLVDRFGARRLLIAGVFLESLAFILIGLLPVYGALLALMGLAGLANAVYHPADYAILNASVDAKRMGRAFSFHTTAGYLGNALAPVTILFLTVWVDWRVALALCGLGGLLTAACMVINAGALRDTASADAAQASRSGVGLLLSAPILMGLLFFTGLSLAGHGINDFGVSALNLRYGASLETAGLVLSAYLFASPVGVLVGGWVADRVQRHDLVAALCFVAAGSAFAGVGLLPASLLGVGALFAVAGFSMGLVAPSRDMMIRALTPPGAMGKVFGFVSVGYNLGGIAAPLAFGYLLDHGDPAMLFWAVAGVSVLSIATVLETGRRGRSVAQPVKRYCAARRYNRGHR